MSASAEAARRGSIAVMLDALMARQDWVSELQAKAARALYGYGLRANAASVLGGVCGVIAGVLFGCGATLGAIGALLLSAGLDALDGSIARICAAPTRWGGVLDLTMDRVVEAAVLLGLMWRYPAIQIAGAVVLATWYVNITVFMATGAAIGASEKLIHYPPGLVERTEAILFFVVLAVAPAVLQNPLCYLYAALEIGTALQRMSYARGRLID